MNIFIHDVMRRDGWPRSLAWTGDLQPCRPVPAECWPWQIISSAGPDIWQIHVLMPSTALDNMRHYIDDDPAAAVLINIDGQDSDWWQAIATVRSCIRQGGFW